MPKFKPSHKGPWSSEPDSVDFVTSNGYHAHIRRHVRLGHLCGYLEVPPKHPWHRKDYSEIDVSVHGGLTFSDAYIPVAFDGSTRAVHDSWVLGFDCAHTEDLIPGSHFPAPELMGFETYRDIEYVRGELEALAAAAAEEATKRSD